VTDPREVADLKIVGGQVVPPTTRISVSEAQLALIAAAHMPVRETQARLQGLLDMALAQAGISGHVVGWEAKPEPVLIVMLSENGKPADGP